MLGVSETKLVYLAGNSNPIKRGGVVPAEERLICCV